MSDNPLWFKDAVFYEVYIRAFHDTTGDGNGDIQGLIKKLDYLKELGVDCLWLLPIYPSPLIDDGYDIADFYGVNPDYGTIEDFKDLFKITDKEVASLLAVNTRTITRLKKDIKHKLPLTMSDRLYRMFNILAIAIKVFNNVDEAVNWLKTKQYGLEEYVPLDLLKTEAGAREVETELMRIEYGIY